MRAICFLTVRPVAAFVEFCKKLKNDAYDVFICVDDNSHSIPEFNDTVKIIKMDNAEAEREGFKSCVLTLPNKACSRDKALYYFARMDTTYEQIWFIEEDVFVPTVTTISDIDAKYPGGDLLTSGHSTNAETRNWPHWKHVVHTNRIKLPLPYATSMICAIRVSKAMLSAVDAYATAHKNLFMDEALFNTLAIHNNLSVLPITELSTILWRHPWKLADIQPTHLYHPVKRIAHQVAWRNGDEFKIDLRLFRNGKKNAPALR
jgi:hypothetical protein